MTKSALILGITGQDGSYLAHHLLNLGYKVIGASRDSYICDKSRLKRLGILEDVELCSISLTEFRSILQAVSFHKPSQIYNLAGLTSVGLSFELPVECMESIATATINLVEVIRFLDSGIRLFNAGSSECFGDTGTNVADENTLLKPLSPYAVAKASAFWQIYTYRKAYNIFCCTGILANHESPLRPTRFVTQKIVQSACNIHNGTANKVILGNILVSRDWGWAPEYVQAMHLMLTAETPNDYIIASGTTVSLKTFAELIYSKFDLNFSDYYRLDPSLCRPSELETINLDPSKIYRNLGWRSTNSIQQIADKLCSNELF